MEKKTKHWHMRFLLHFHNSTIIMIIIIIITKKENFQTCGLCCPGWPQNKTERKWKERSVPGPC